MKNATSLNSLLTINYLRDLAESHIECWKDRYFRKKKADIRFDLRLNHDDSLEIERIEEDLKRKLTDREREVAIKKFHSAVVKHIY